jgi:hypothetical protein
MRTNRLLLSALAVAAVLAIAVAWLSFSPSGTRTGEAAAGLTAPSVDRTTVASSDAELPSPGPVLASGSGIASSPLPIPRGNSNPGSPLEAGARYVTSDPFPVRLSFVAPSGWAGNIGGPYAVWAGPAATGDALSFQLNLTVIADPCHPDQGTVATSTPPTAADLVQAIISRPGLARATPTPASLGGRPATSFRLTLSAPASECSNGTYLLWQLPLGATNELQTGMSERISVIDVNGLPLVVTAVDTTGETAAERQAIQQAIDSIEFEPGG